jgi:hypothetical protein
MRLRTGIERSGVVEWDLGPIPWLPSELERVRKLPRKSQWTCAWAKRLRKPVDGRCFEITKGGGFIRIKDKW